MFKKYFSTTNVFFRGIVFLLLDCQLFAATLDCFSVRVWKWDGSGNNPMGISWKWK